MSKFSAKKSKQKLPISDITLIAMFSAILVVCSWISIPAAVPFSLQTFGVFLAAGILGGKRGSLTVLTYILLGLLGVPVFAGFAGGFGYLFGSTGGYIIGFLFSALAMWLIESLFGKSKWVLLLSMILGLLVCYSFGTAWFMTIYAKSAGAIGVWTALTLCVIPYIIPDAIKIGLAFVISIRLRRYAEINSDI